MAFRALAPRRGERRTARDGALLREQAAVAALVPRLAQMTAETGPKAMKPAHSVRKEPYPSGGPSSAEDNPSDAERGEAAAAAQAAGETVKQKARTVDSEQALQEATEGIDVAGVVEKTDEEVYHDLYIQHSNVSTARSKLEETVTTLKKAIKKGSDRDATDEQRERAEEAKKELEGYDTSRYKRRKQKVEKVTVDENTGSTTVKEVLVYVEEIVAYAEINDVELIVPLNCWKARGLEPTAMWQSLTADDPGGDDAWRKTLSSEESSEVDAMLAQAQAALPQNRRDAQAAVPMYFKARKAWQPDKGDYDDLGVEAGHNGVPYQCQRAPTQEALLDEFAKIKRFAPQELEEKGLPEDWNDKSDADKIAWYLRSDLYQFTVDANDEMTGGSVTLTSDALLGQRRGYGPRRPFEGGPFIERCKYPAGMERDERGFVTEPWKEAYNRANRYRMEVARLWWKLYHFQSEETAQQTENLSGVFKKREGRDGALFEHYMVLAITEFGNEGFLKTGTISPHHEFDDLTNPDNDLHDEDATMDELAEERDEDKVDYAREFKLSSKGANQLVDNRYPKNGTKNVRADYDRTWPIAHIDHSLEWAAFSAGAQILVNNRQFYNMLRYFFGPLVDDETDVDEDARQKWMPSKGFIQNSFDWDETAWEDFIKPIAFAEGGEPTWEKNGGDTLAVMELAFDNLIKAMPLWAHMFLSPDLVEDPELQQKDAMAVDSANGVLRGVHNALQKVPADSTAATRLLCFDTQVRAEFQGRGAYRDAASIVYHSYPSDSEADRDLIDKRGANRDRYGIIDPLTEKPEFPWAQEHLMRGVSRVERPGDNMNNENYAIDSAIVVPKFGYMAAQAYRQWWLEKYMKVPFGPGWTVALQNMHTFEISETPWYVQAQGLYGVVTAVDEIPSPENPLERHLYTVTVLRDEFRLHKPDEDLDDDGDGDEGGDAMTDAAPAPPSGEAKPAKLSTREWWHEQGHTTADGELIVKVTGAHIWPRWTSTVATEDVTDPKHKTHIRYGDKVRVANQTRNQLEKALTDSGQFDANQISKMLMPYRTDVDYAAIGYTWLAPLDELERLNPYYGTFHKTSVRLSFAEQPEGYDPEVAAKLKKVGNLQLVPWDAERETQFSYLKYRNDDMELVKESERLDMTLLRSEVTQYIPAHKQRLNETTRQYVDDKRAGGFVAVPFQNIDMEDDTL